MHATTTKEVRSEQPESRETFRRQTMHQFMAAGIALYNPDQPNRAVISPDAVYQIEPDTLRLLRSFGSAKWNKNLERYRDVRQTLTARYAREREMKKLPVRVHELSPSRLAAPGTLRRSHFRRDHSLSLPGATDAGYRSSGWTRGHLVPARDLSFDEQAYRDSFLLSNAVPQNARMNRAEWRRLENQVRKLVETADSVIVVTGAIFTEDPKRIGASGVAVPAELYKVVLALRDGEIRLTAAILPNTESRGSLESFAVPVAEVERKTGEVLPTARTGPLESNVLILGERPRYRSIARSSQSHAVTAPVTTSATRTVPPRKPSTRIARPASQSPMSHRTTMSTPPSRNSLTKRPDTL